MRRSHEYRDPYWDLYRPLTSGPFPCLLLPLSGVLVSDLLLDLGDLLDLGELLLGLLGRLGLVAALPLGETDRLLEDLAGSCWVLLICLLLPPG